MGGTLDTIIVCILRIFVLLYLYQTIYMLVGLFCKPKRFTAKNSIDMAYLYPHETKVR